MGNGGEEHAAIRQDIGGRYSGAEAPLRTRMIRSSAGHASIYQGGAWDWPLWLLIVAVVLCVAALISIWIGRYHSTAARIVWTFVAILIPILGPIAWFLLGWERRG